MKADLIREMLSQYRPLRAEQRFLQSLSPRGEDSDLPPILKRKLGILDTLPILLPDEEWFVLRKHVIDGMTWAYVLVEYEKRWGVALGKHDRTLKRIQAQAFVRISAFLEENGHAAYVEALFSPETERRVRADKEPQEHRLSETRRFRPAVRKGLTGSRLSKRQAGSPARTRKRCINRGPHSK